MIRKVLVLVGAISVVYSTSAAAFATASFKVADGHTLSSGFEMFAFKGLSNLKKFSIDGNAVLDKIENGLIDFDGFSQVTNPGPTIKNLDDSKLPGLAALGI